MKVNQDSISSYPPISNDNLVNIKAFLATERIQQVLPIQGPDLNSSQTKTDSLNSSVVLSNNSSSTSTKTQKMAKGIVVFPSLPSPPRPIENEKKEKALKKSPVKEERIDQKEKTKRPLTLGDSSEESEIEGEKRVQTTRSDTAIYASNEAKESSQLEKEDYLSYQMQLTYLLGENSGIKLALTPKMELKIETFQDSLLKGEEKVFDYVIELILNQAKEHRSPTCLLSDGSTVRYSELLRRLSSCAWGKQVMEAFPQLKTKLDDLHKKLIYIEFGVYKEKIHIKLAEKAKKWQKGEKDVEGILDIKPPCKVFYRAKSKNIYLLPLNVEEDSIHFLGKGEFKSASRLLNYTTGEVLACCNMVKITDPDRKGLQEGIMPKSIKEIDCLKKLAQTPGVLNLVDFVEYEEEGKKGKPIKKLLMITPLCEGGIFGNKGVIQEKYIQLAREDKLKIMIELLLGLKTIHAEGIIHQDINISNILMKQDALTGEWKALIFDFGQAELFSEGGNEVLNVFKKNVPFDVLEMGKVFYRFFIDPNTDLTFQGTEWTSAAYQKMYNALTDPDLGIKQAIMQMLSPMDMKQRPNAEQAYQLIMSKSFT